MTSAEAVVIEQGAPRAAASARPATPDGRRRFKRSHIRPRSQYRRMPTKAEPISPFGRPPTIGHSALSLCPAYVRGTARECRRNAAATVRDGHVVRFRPPADGSVLLASDATRPSSARRTFTLKIRFEPLAEEQLLPRLRKLALSRWSCRTFDAARIHSDVSRSCSTARQCFANHTATRAIPFAHP